MWLVLRQRNVDTNKAKAGAQVTTNVVSKVKGRSGVNPVTGAQAGFGCQPVIEGVTFGTALFHVDVISNAGDLFGRRTEFNVLGNAGC